MMISYLFFFCAGSLYCSHKICGLQTQKDLEDALLKIFLQYLSW